MSLDTSEGAGSVPPGDADQRPIVRRRARRSVWARITVLSFVVVAVVLGAVASANAGVIGSYLTHRVGGPPRTWPVSALPDGSLPAVRIALVGDVGDGGTREHRTAAAIAGQSRVDPYDLLVLLGDNVYPSGDPDRLPATVYEPFSPVLDNGTELLAVLGNHDVADGHGDAQLAALGMPGRWYAARRGDVLIVGLDSNDPSNPDQLAWLEDTLATSDAVWKIAVLHHPPYSSGYHGSNAAARDAFVPLFERFGVQLVVAGHDHDYQRSAPINGITYIVTGGGSRTRRTGTSDFTMVAYATHHYVDLNVYPDHLLLRAIDQDGEQFDQTVIAPQR